MNANELNLKAAAAERRRIEIEMYGKPIHGTRVQERTKKNYTRKKKHKKDEETEI